MFKWLLYLLLLIYTYIYSSVFVEPLFPDHIFILTIGYAVPSLFYFDYFYKMRIIFNRTSKESKIKSTRQIESKRFKEYLCSEAFLGLISSSFGYCTYSTYLIYTINSLRSAIHAGTRLLIFLPFESLFMMLIGLLFGLYLGKRIQSRVMSLVEF